jgi:hypothetical protein
VLPLHPIEPDKDSLSKQAGKLNDFIDSNAIEELNIAGSRESKESGIYRFTLRILQAYWLTLRKM